MQGGRRKTPGGIDGVSFQSLTWQYVENVFRVQRISRAASRRCSRLLEVYAICEKCGISLLYF